MAGFLHGDKSTNVVDAPIHLLPPAVQQQSRADPSGTALPLTRHPEQDQCHLSLKSWRKPSGSAHMYFSGLEKWKTSIWGTRPQDLKSSCYSWATCTEAIDAGIGWPLFPAHFLSPPLLATTETTWLPISDSTSCPNHSTAAATPSPTAFSFPCPCTSPALSPGCEGDTAPAWEVSIQCLEQSCIERWNHLVISACVEQTKQTLVCTFVYASGYKEAKMVKKIMLPRWLQSFWHKCRCASETQQKLGKHSR